LGLAFRVVPPQDESPAAGIDESPLPGESPSELVQRLSRLKAEIVAATLSLSPAAVSAEDSDNHLMTVILSADTVVVLNDKILGKPDDPAEATGTLRLLRQRPHYVYSGLTVASQRPDPGLHSEKWQFITRLHQSKVWMRAYTDAEIEQYVAGGSPLDKAGAYGIQDQPFAPVARLDGCYASVMGLPLGELATALEAIKLSLPNVAPHCTGITGTPCCLLSRSG